MAVPANRTFWKMVRVLHQFEGTRCLWRVPLAGLLLSATALLPFAGAIAGVYLAADTDRLPLVILGVLCAVGSAVTAPTLWRHRPWARLISGRLWSYERPVPAPIVPVLVEERDLDRALAAVRRAKLNPSGILRLGQPPPDVPFLRTKITVMEAADWAASSSDEALVRRVVEVFRTARITARVAGIDIRAITTEPTTPAAPSPDRGTDKGLANIQHPASRS